jgi:small-conductance mechanosensitive channel/CRP-like cAMP-binding protein
MSLIEIGVLCAVGVILLSFIVFLRLCFIHTKQKELRSFQTSLIFFIVCSVILLLTHVYYESFFHVKIHRFDSTELVAILWWIVLFFVVKNTVAYFVWFKTFEKNNILVPKIFKDLTSLALMIIILAGVIHFVFSGSVLSLFTASGFLAIILGYSAQSVLGDVFSGIALNLFKQFKVGDYIKILGIYGVEFIGKVVQINTRFVEIVTINGNSLTIPNSLVAKQAVFNLSEPDPYIEYNFDINVSNTISPVIIKNLLAESAEEAVSVLEKPAPYALLISMKGSEYTYQLHITTTEVNEKIVLNEVLSIFWYKCRREHIKISNNEFAEIIHFSQDQVKAILKQVDIFSMLTNDELQNLIEESQCLSFGPPERILKYRQQNRNMFVILKGGVDVYITDPELSFESKVASLDETKYFGEMSLLTGAACSASVYANQESLILEISQYVMKNLFTARPELMEQISQIIVQRELMNKEMTEKEKKELNMKKEMVTPLMNLIRTIFA